MDQRRVQAVKVEKENERIVKALLGVEDKASGVTLLALALGGLAASLLGLLAALLGGDLLGLEVLEPVELV